MKAKQKIRALRILAIAGSLSALAVPTAVARPATDVPFRSENAIATATATQSYQLPSGFHSEVQAYSPAKQQPFQLRRSFKPEVQTPSSPTVASNPGSVVREIRTVTDNGSPTLAIVLAALALAIALSGIAYAWVRLTRMQRDMSSRALVG
jgi:hypothetical protein